MHPPCSFAPHPPFCSTPLLPKPSPEQGGSREEVGILVEELLQEKGPMLEEYLAMEVGERGPFWDPIENSVHQSSVHRGSYSILFTCRETDPCLGIRPLTTLTM